VKKHTLVLQKLNACSEAVEYADTFPTLQKAWDSCERGDWMLWLIGKKSGNPENAKRKKLVLCACECARLALKYTKDPRVVKCIEVCEAWAKGKATIAEVREARLAAYAAYAAAAAAAAYAAYAAYAAAAYAAAGAARIKTLKTCADIVRKHYPKVPK
jgi:hypothetical protein